MVIETGKRLREARKLAGLSQEKVASILEISRSRYSEIESGKKTISIDELYRFSELYNRNIEYFLRNEAEKEEPLGALYRAVSHDLDLARTVAKFQTLCSNLVFLRKILNVEDMGMDIEDYSYDLSKKFFWAKYYAEQERIILGVGKEPVKNLSEVLAEKKRINIFALSLPDNVSGMFTYSKEIGGCILINGDHAAGRQLFTLAHEYGHYVFHKKRVAIVDYLHKDQSKDEKFVNIFAAEFLMPKETVKKIFYSHVGESKAPSAEDILYLADYFGSSFEATLNRLRDLKLIKESIKQQFLDARWISRLRNAMGVPEPSGIKEELPRSYKIFCFKAFLRNKISTTKLADLLDMPLHRIMEIAQNLRAYNAHAV
jgi:Zn-dependent peptidase ImmA (M78 family)/DNA-binding XRE family transcriptional regulator